MEKIILSQLSAEEIRQLIREELLQVLRNYQDVIQDPDSRKNILNFEEGCAYIGISKSHGYKLTSQGKIPHAKRGKRIFFEKSELDAWMMERKVKTADELRKEAEEYLKKMRR
jgi:excisionase family DNA binding protein